MRGGGGLRRVREWLAPLLHEPALPSLLQHVMPDLDLSSLAWQPLHPRAFARAVKPNLIMTSLVTLVSESATIRKVAARSLRRVRKGAQMRQIYRLRRPSSE